MWKHIDIIEDAGISRRIASWGASDRILGDVDDLVDVFQAFHFVDLSRSDPDAIQRFHDRFSHRLNDQ